MVYKISPALTVADYEAIAACVGFSGTTTEFVAFVIDQQRKAFMLPEEITYPMKIADGPPVDMSKVTLASTRSPSDYVDHVESVRISDRPPMVYGSGRA
jgi:hypothetical protein